MRWRKHTLLLQCSAFSTRWKEPGILVEILKNKTLSLHWHSRDSPQKPYNDRAWFRKMRVVLQACVSADAKRQEGQLGVGGLDLHRPFAYCLFQRSIISSCPIITRAWNCVFPKVTKHHRNIFLTKTWNKRILAYEKDTIDLKIFNFWSRNIRQPRSSKDSAKWILKI